MTSPSVRLQISAATFVLLSTCALGQRGSANDPARAGGPVDMATSTSPIAEPRTNPRSVYIAGKVVVQGGGPVDQVIIERVCSGIVRHEGRTNAKGEYQIELGRNQQDRDASQEDSDRMVSSRGLTAGTGGRSQVRYDDCDLRASLPGFVSTTVPMRVEDDINILHVSTIVLTRMAGVEGATVSASNMAASKDARAAFERGRKAGAEKNYDEAIRELTRAVTLYPQYAGAWSLMGEIHRLQNQFDQARKEYGQAITSDPKFVSPYFGLAAISVIENKWDDAADYTDQLIRLNPYAYPMAFYFNAAANYNLGKLDTAEQNARKFEQMDTAHTRPDIAVLLGNILTAKHQYAEAAQSYRAFLAAKPDAPNAEQLKKEAQRLETLSTAKQQ
ncbi:MAG TPA: tetratricopeptide repeat protein [Candidatus Angelobacter sp.]|nr:tetratricopeptide repeat protein [Candidatus Angelobacter sp.]